jgi:4'-phosphopantetheinyl transferase
VEYLRPRSDLLSLARRFFSPREADTLANLPADLQTTAFHACWTRKEAFVKAKGQGLSLGLDQFEVSLEPGEPAALLATRWDPAEAGRWSLRALTPAPGYLGALAVEGHRWRLQHRQWLLAVSPLRGDGYLANPEETAD